MLISLRASKPVFVLFFVCDTDMCLVSVWPFFVSEPCGGSAYIDFHRDLSSAAGYIGEDRGRGGIGQ